MVRLSSARVELKSREEVMKTLTVRGIEFASTAGYVPLGELTKLYLVFRALDGDKLAIEILEAAGTIVTDNNGNQIWPRT